MSYQEREELHLAFIEKLQEAIEVCWNEDQTSLLVQILEEEETAWAEFQAERKIL